MTMEKIYEVLISYHNEDPDAFDGLGGHSRAEEMVKYLVTHAQDLPNEDGFNFGGLIISILDTFGEKDFHEIDKGLKL